MDESWMELRMPVTCLEQTVTLANNYICERCYEQQGQEKNLAK